MFYTFYQQRSNNILVRYKADGSSETKSKTIELSKPTLFKISDELSEVTTINDEFVKPIEFSSVYEAKDFAKQYKDVENFGLCGNSNYANQFMIELFEGKSADYKEEQIRCAYIDIEVEALQGFPDPKEADWPINGVSVYDSITKTFYVFGLEYDGCEPFDVDNLPEELKEHIRGFSINYVAYTKEEDLLRGLLTHFHEFAYDNSTGWNSDGFDMPYIVNRCYKLFGKAYTKNLLSPFKDIKHKENYDTYGDQEIVDIVGLPHLDYLNVYKKHRLVPRESYKLDFIAECELGRNKVDYSEAKDLQGLYRADFPKFMVYNIIDVDIIVKLEEKLSLLSLCYAMAYYSISNYSDTLGTVKMWEQLIAKYLYANNKVPPFNKLKYEGDSDFKGAHVREPVTGMHTWLMSWDLKSLYPHVIQQWNIGPETLVRYEDLPESVQHIKDNYTFDDIFDRKIDTTPLIEHNLSMAANFQFYKNDKMSFLSAIMRELYTMRSAFKKKMLQAQRNAEETNDPLLKKKYKLEEITNNSMQHGLKILLNSGYGACGNKNFLYYEIENAEAITMSSQLVNRWTSTKLEDFLRSMFKDEEGKYWVYGDTDSVVGDTIIDVDGVNVSIQDLYDSLPNDYIKCDQDNKNYIKTVNTKTTLSVSNQGEIERKDIKYIMKHTVKKKMYRVKINNNHVDITGDHSIMVERDKKMISCKVNDILPNDILMSIN